MIAGRDAMATVARLRFLVAALVVLVIAAVVALVVSPGSAAKREADAQPTATAIATRSPQIPTPLPTLVVAQDILPAQANAYAIGVQGPGADDLIILQTLVWQGATQGHLVFWRANDELKMQLLPAVADETSPRGQFQDTSSVIRYGVQQISVGRRELGIVYGPAGGCCPASGLALLRLDGDQWRIVWDAADYMPDWRGENGQVEFPHGDLSEVIVRGDSHSSVVLASGRPGQYYSVDTWARQGDQYVRQSAETVPAPYATLVDFITALRANDEEGALKLVSDKALVARARQLGLPAPADMPFGVTCDDDLECGKTAPLVSNMGLPFVVISFVEQDGQWLISDIEQAP